MNEFEEIFSAPNHKDLEDVVLVLARAGIGYNIEAAPADFSPNMSFALRPDQVRVLVAIWDMGRARKALEEAGLFEPTTEQAPPAAEEEDRVDEEAEAEPQTADQRSAGKNEAEHPSPKESDRTAEPATNAHKTRQLSPISKLLWIAVAVLSPLIGIVVSAVIGLYTAKDADDNSYFLFRKQDRLFALVLAVISLGFFVGLIALERNPFLIIP